MPTPNKYPRELRERAVRMVAGIGEPGAIRRVGEKLGMNPETVRYWVNHAPAEIGGKSGLSSEQLEELKSLHRNAHGVSAPTVVETLYVVEDRGPGSVPVCKVRPGRRFGLDDRHEALCRGVVLRVTS